MSILAEDDFDRVGSLGSLWTTLLGAFACDGDKAAESGLPAVNNWAVMTVYPDAAGVSARRIESRITRNDEGDGTAGVGTSVPLVEFGLLARVAFHATLGTYYLVEVGWQSQPAPVLFVRTRTTLFPTPFLPPGYVTTWAYTWPALSTKFLRVEFGVAGTTNTLSVYVDDVLIGSVPMAVLAPLGGYTQQNKAGIFSNRALVVASGSTTPPGIPQFDRFEVANFELGYSSETPPGVAATPSLTEIVIASEGLIASAVALPVTPDEVWDESHAWRVGAERTESGHLVRFPKGSRKRRTWGFGWSGTVHADVESLRTWIAGLKGSVGIGTYTTPEGQVLYFFVMPSRMTFTGSGKKTRRIALVATECFAT